MRIKAGSVPPQETQAASASRLFNNNLDGTFADLAPAHGLALADLPDSAVVHDDFDNDRDIDMVVLSPSSQPLCWENFRVGQYRLLDAKATKLDVTGAISATTGNPFKTGNRDLLVFAGKELVLYHNPGRWEFQRDIEFSTKHGSLGGTGGQFVDIDNDGDLDLVIADAHRRDGSRGPALLFNDWPNTRFVDAADGDPRSEPDAAAGCLLGPDILIQRDDRYSRLHRDRQACHEVHLSAKRPVDARRGNPAGPRACSEPGAQDSRPEPSSAGPTLPLAASLGLTFSYNVTIGIPVYIEIARLVMRYI